MANWNSLSLSKQITKQINGGSILGSGLNTISIGATGTSSVFSEEYQPHVKKYEVFEIEEDILLLSVVWQRMRQMREDHQRKNNSVLPFEMPTSMTSSVLFSNITTEDRDRTVQIRDYYHKKIMMWTLNEIRLSNFREDLKKFLQSDGKIFQENMKPLVYRLPEFYDYDIMFDEMFLEHNTQVAQERQVEAKTKKLSLVKTVMRKRRHAFIKEFWLSDENNNLNLITVNKDNPLIGLLEHYANTPFKISGLFRTQNRDNRQYSVLEKYSFS